ncbi:hypothetical protein BDV11DRAFT_175611 [Aspergillus similis]
MSIGEFPAIDYFGDGSFFLMYSEGHTREHMYALAHTSENEFISLEAMSHTTLESFVQQSMCLFRVKSTHLHWTVTSSTLNVRLYLHVPEVSLNIQERK